MKATGQNIETFAVHSSSDLETIVDICIKMFAVTLIYSFHSIQMFYLYLVSQSNNPACSILSLPSDTKIPHIKQSIQ